MNYANLEILGITLPIGLNKYHDDGFVESILKHERELNKKYDINNVDKNNKVLKNSEGYCTIYVKTLKLFLTQIYQIKCCHVCYLKQPIEIWNILLRAHEETHALDLLGGIDILSEKLLEEQKIKINFKEIDEYEVRAELGSIYAINARKISVLDRLFVDQKRCEGTIIAKKIYEQSKLPRKKFFLF